MITATQLEPVDDVEHFERLCALLETMDDAPAGESGTLVFPNGRGMILVQSGRVCWASTPDVATRLSHRLRNEPSVDTRQMAAVFRECRESGKPFGEMLVQRGVVTFELLRRALLQHTAETLLHLASYAAPRWVPSNVERYDRSLTFTSAELLTHSADVWWGPLAAEVRNELAAALGGRGAVGLAFLRAAGTHDAIVPVDIASARELRVKDALAAGRETVELLRSSARIGGRLAAGTCADGRSFVAWIENGAYYVAIAEERSEIGFIVGHLSRRAAE